MASISPTIASQELIYGGTSTALSNKTDTSYTSLGAAVVTTALAAQQFTVEVELFVPTVTVAATAVAYIAIQSSDGVTTYADTFFYAGVANATSEMRLVKRFPAGAAIPALRGAYKTVTAACGFSGGATVGEMFIRARLV